MFDKLGVGWGNSVLALVALVIGIPAPFVFYKFGPKLRAMSPAARAARAKAMQQKQQQQQQPTAVTETQREKGPQNV